MFTGIVELLGRVRSFANGVLIVEADFAAEPVQAGESISLNGCCLTAVQFLTAQYPRPCVRFDLSPETLARTTLGELEQGTKVNLERAMRADGRFGGHIVQGHVDDTGRILSITPSEGASVFRFEAPAEYERYLIEKGSVTVDGISLTVVRLEGTEFEAWVIPHTLEQTTLRERKVGDRVNLEFDALAKYVERLLKFRQ